MLPNWLYGKSKSKLANILGGGGGTPSDYNQVKAQVTQNTEDIASLSDTLDTKAALTQISNPNLLDNPWFTVNQRGQSTYNLTGNEMTLDRWATAVSSGTMIVGVSSNGLAITEASDVGDGAFIERIDKPELLGKTVTISIDDGANIYHATGTIPNVQPVNWTEVCSVTTSGGINAALFISPVNVTAFQLQYVIRVPKDNTAYIIRAVKLELGSVSTLAMDTAPNYATELAKCQRYFQRLKNTKNDGDMIALAIPSTETYVKFMLSAVPMRTNPTMTPSNLSDIKYSATDYAGGVDITSLITNPMQIGNNLGCGAAVSSVTVGSIYKIYIAPSGYIDLSAEL